jgi:nicotinate-nucleotide--dimethylbenzimidazole phosphoribosyltransferase
MSLEWINNPIASLDAIAHKNAEKRQAILTKPAGSLGVLEQLAIQFSAWQGTDRPALNQLHISIFAADHGVAEEGVSAFPQVVTQEMVKNFVVGGAAINVLAKYNQATLEIIDVGVKDLPKLDSVIQAKAGNATQNIVHMNAMTEEQLQLALQAGKEAADRAKANNVQLFIGGEMGIANTTSSTAIACELLDISDTSQLTGAGTGLDQAGVKHKSAVVSSIIQRYKEESQHQKTQIEQSYSLNILRIMGGFEIVALVAAFIRCAQHGIPVLIDGFITTSAALVAITMNDKIKQWMLFSHCSAEAGHEKMLSALDVKPLIDFELRLGEASGAAILIPIIKQALALHNSMATFEEAKVSQG